MFLNPILLKSIIVQIQLLKYLPSPWCSVVYWSEKINRIWRHKVFCFYCTNKLNQLIQYKFVTEVRIVAQYDLVKVQCFLEYSPVSNWNWVNLPIQINRAYCQRVLIWTRVILGHKIN